MEPKYKPGTKGHVLDYGSEGNSFTFDLDEDGGVVNLRPTDDNDQFEDADMIADPKKSAKQTARSDA